jgi:hypothetical protein
MSDEPVFDRLGAPLRQQEIAIRSGQIVGITVNGGDGARVPGGEKIQQPTTCNKLFHKSDTRAGLGPGCLHG